MGGSGFTAGGGISRICEGPIGSYQRKVAEALGMGTGSSVSQQLTKWRNRAKNESAWRNLAMRIDR
jgi:hypothetical protein